MSHTVIYIPGLGDRKKPLLTIQRFLLRGWRAFGLKVRMFTVEWTNDSPFDNRFDELLRMIDDLHRAGEQVTVVGASAGASAALSAFIERQDKVRAVVSICGQLRSTKEVLDPALDINPRFKQSLQRMQKNFAVLTDAGRHRILTLRPYLDAVVLPQHATLPGVRDRRMPVVGHLTGIGFAITSEGPRIARFLRRIAK